MSEHPGEWRIHVYGGPTRHHQWMYFARNVAEITWDRDMPVRVNVANLAKVGPNRRFCNVD